MVRKITNFINFIVSAFIVLLIVLVMSGCATTDYQFGDVTKKIDNVGYGYCNETNPETRAMLKMTLNSLGVNIGIDFCTAYGLKTIALGGGGANE